MIVKENVSNLKGFHYFSIDPHTGKILPYSEKTNQQLINFDKTQNSKCQITEEWGKATIIFNNVTNEINQVTENGFRTCFAKEIKKEQKIIKVCVKFVKECNSWYIDNVDPFINYLILIDRSGSMGSKTSNGNTALKEGLININDEIIEPLKKEVKNEGTKIHISFITFEENTSLILDNVNLTADFDFTHIFSEITIGGMTKLYDTVKYAIEIGECIENECAFTNLIIVTDGMDTCSKEWNVNLNGKTKMNKKLDEKKNCLNPWNIVWIGINSHNIESQKYGGCNNSTMNVDNNSMKQAFRSLSCAINRTRTGEDSNVKFRTAERTASAPMHNNNNSIFDSSKIVPTMSRQISNVNFANQNTFNITTGSNSASLPKLIIPDSNIFDNIFDNDWEDLKNDVPNAPRCLNNNLMDTS